MNWEFYRQALGDQLVQCPSSGLAPHPNQLVTDTRKILPGQWFVPLQGQNFDGHDYLATAKEQGAAGIYTETGRSDASGFPVDQQMIVKDTLVALQMTAAAYRKTLTQTTVFAMTGSAGKTTTKAILEAICHHVDSKTHALPGSFNNEIGVPLTVLSCPPDSRYLVVEFGAKRPNDIGFLANMITPDVVACLNVGSAHLEIFGSRQALFETKVEILRQGKPDSKIVPYADDSAILQAAKDTGKAVTSFGVSQDATVRLVATQPLPNGKQSLTVRHRKRELTTDLPFFHEKNGLNAAAAIAMAVAGEVTFEQAVAGCEQFIPAAGRFNIFPIRDKVLVDDSYNANPESMRAGLNSLVTAYPDQSKVVVVGDMLEIGPESHKAHRELGEFIANTVQPVLLACVGPQSVAIADGAKAVGCDNTKHFATADDFLTAYRDHRKLPGEVIFFKASNDIGLQRVVQTYRKSS